MRSVEEKCLIVTCDQAFKITKIHIIKNLNIEIQMDDFLIDLIDPEDYSKFWEFSAALKKAEALFEHELYVSEIGKIKSRMGFGGVSHGDQYTIAIFTHYLDLFETVIKVDCEEMQFLKEQMKKYDISPVIYHQFSELNNELLNLQRESIKKNVQISNLMENTVLLNKELEELNAMKDRIFSIIGHDLRAPLSNIIEGVNLISEDRNLLYELVEVGFFKRLSDSAGHTMFLLENLLEWSKIQLGEQSFKPMSYPLKQLIEVVLDTLRPVALQKDIRIIEDQIENVIALADIRMIEVVIRNLLSNAIKFTNEQGEIHIAVSKEQTFIRVTIVDNGVGMSDEKIKTLFELKKINSERGTSGEKGTGFGLLLCDQFVKQNGGTLSISSKIGEGTSVTFTVPIYNTP